MSHTPGPWGWTYDWSGTYSIGRADDPQVLPIANVHSRDFIGAADNCNLIAAAPDMLATLKAIVANSDEDNEWDAVDKLHRNRDAAELIIAKAEGR